VLPSVKQGFTSVADANFANLGLVWPNSFADPTAKAGAADEVVTLTFQDDDLTTVISPAVQASVIAHDGGGRWQSCRALRWCVCTRGDVEQPRGYTLWHCWRTCLSRLRFGWEGDQPRGGSERIGHDGAILRRRKADGAKIG
jgi:hypothetical protein